MWMIDPKFNERIAWAIIATIASMVLWAVFLFVVIPAWKETFL